MSQQRNVQRKECRSKRRGIKQTFRQSTTVFCLNRWSTGTGISEASGQKVRPQSCLRPYAQVAQAREYRYTSSYSRFQACALHTPPSIAAFRLPRGFRRLNMTCFALTSFNVTLVFPLSGEKQIHFSCSHANMGTVRKDEFVKTRGELLHVILQM